MRHTLAAAACLVSLAACAGYPDINGQLALSRQGDHPVVLIHTCHGGVDELDLAADRQGLAPEQTNPSLGRLRARRTVSGDIAVDLVDPGPQWEVVTPVTLPTDPGRGVIVTAGQRSADTEMKQVSAHVGQLRSLQPGTVLVDGQIDDVAGRPTSTETFRAEACPR